MITGIIQRRTAARASLQAELNIRFFDGKNNEVVATATNISAGGINFSVTQGSLRLQLHDRIEFIFRLPTSGEIKVISEIRHLDVGEITKGFHYGVKFLDISLEDWKSIMKYCRNVSVTTSVPMVSGCPNFGDSKNPAERKNINVNLLLDHQLRLTGTIEDISFGGSRINTAKLIPVDSKVTMEIFQGKSILKIPGTCVWSAPEKATEESFLAGIFFADLDKPTFEGLRKLVNS